jgi:hypothetical protein
MRGDIAVGLLMIAEAHASDEWPIGGHVSVRQHASLLDRIAATHSFLTRYAFAPIVPVLSGLAMHDPITCQGHTSHDGKGTAAAKVHVWLDNMSDDFSRTLAAHPLNWYVFDAACRLVYTAEPQDTHAPPTQGGYRGYNAAHLLAFLATSSHAMAAGLPGAR